MKVLPFPPNAVAGFVVRGDVFDCELPMTLLADWGKHGLQSNTLALTVEAGTEGFDSPLS